MLCILRGSLLALYPKQGHGWRGTRCGHWQMVSQGASPSLDSACYMTSVPDGLLINTHPLKTCSRGCAEGPSIWTPLRLLCGIMCHEMLCWWQLGLISQSNIFVQSLLFEPKAKMQNKAEVLRPFIYFIMTHTMIHIDKTSNSSSY